MLGLEREALPAHLFGAVQHLGCFPTDHKAALRFWLGASYSNKYEAAAALRDLASTDACADVERRRCAAGWVVPRCAPVVPVVGLKGGCHASCGNRLDCYVDLPGTSRCSHSLRPFATPRSPGADTRRPAPTVLATLRWLAANAAL